MELLLELLFELPLSGAFKSVTMCAGMIAKFFRCLSNGIGRRDDTRRAGASRPLVMRLDLSVVAGCNVESRRCGLLVPIG